MNQYSVTSAGLGEGLARSASALQLAGNTFEEAAALIGATSEVTQDPEKAGNAMKTLSLRLRGMKGELEELGEETEGVENISKMQGQILNMTKGKVNIFDDAGNFKSTYDIMKGIAEVYDDLSSTDRADLLETIAGKNRANDVAALISNFDTAIKMVETAENSAGSAAGENAKYLDSLQGRIDVMTASLQAMSVAAMDSSFLKGGVSAITALIDAFTSFVDIVGLIPTLIGAAAGAFAMFGNRGIVTVDKLNGKLKIFGQSFGEFKNNVGSLVKGFISGDFGGELDKVLGDTQSPFKLFKQQMDVDKKAFDEYQKRFASGATGEQLNSALAGSSKELREFIATTDEASRTWNNFSNSQGKSFAAMQASNKSLRSASGIIKEYNSNCKNVGMTQAQFVETVNSANPVMGGYLKSLAGTRATMGGYASALIGATAKTVGLTVASTALNMVLTMGIGVAISAVIGGIASLITYYDDLAKSVEESSSAFEQANNQIMTNKSAYDEAVQSYDKLSKGVNKFGENVSLSAEEYAEYQNAVNTIADSAPSMVAGFDAQGNAILNTTANVKSLIDAYNELIVAEAKAFVEGDAEKGYVGKEKVFEDYIHDLEGMQRDDLESYQKLNELLSSDDIEGYISDMAPSDIWSMRDRLVQMGFEKDLFQSNEDFIAESIRNDTEKVRDAVSERMTEYENIASEAKQITQAMLNEILYDDETFVSMNDSVRNMMTEYVSSLDGAFYEELVNKNDGNKAKAIQGLEEYIGDITDSFARLTETQQQTISDAFDMQVEFESGNVSMNEFAAKAKEMDSVLRDIGLDEDARKEMMLSLGFEYDDNGNLEKWTSDYETALNRVQEETGINKTSLEGWLGNLSGSELDMVMNMELEGVDTIDELQQALDLAKALNGIGSIDIAFETDSLDKLNSAISESNAATGLTQESIESVKARYTELENFDPSALFEKTTTGVRLNTQALSALEKQYVANRKAANEQNISALAKQYKQLGEQIDAASAAGDNVKADALKAQQSAISDSIEEAQMLASAYDGMTSAYNEWVNAQSAGQEGDIYDSILSGMESAQELANDNKWGNTELQSFIKMFSAEGSMDNATPQQFADSWGSAIQKANRYFQEGTQGIDNFFADIQAKNAELLTETDGKLNFAPDVDVSDVAETLGIAESTVEAIVNMANEYGAEISIGVEQQSLDELIADSEKAAQEASDALKSTLGEDFEISYDLKVNEDGTSNAQAELDKLKAKRDEINNSDATVEVKEQGVEAVNQQIMALNRELIQATQPKFMSLDVSQVSASMQDALTKAQEMQTAINNLNALKADQEAGITIDTSDIDAAQQKVNECAEAIAGLDGDVKVAIGLEEDGSIESIISDFSENKVKIDADTSVADSAIKETKETIDKIEDKDVTLTVKVEGLDEAKELGKVLDVAVKVDGEVENLSKYAEAAKELSSVDDNITKTATVDIKGNVGGTFGFNPALDNLDRFAEGAERLKGVSDVEATVTANLDSNLGGFAGLNPALNNLDKFAEASSKIENIGDVEANITANLDGNLGLNLGIGNLETFADGAKKLEDVETKSVTITADLRGNLGLNLGVGNLETFADGAKKLQDVETKDVTITANLKGNVTNDAVSRLQVFSNTVSALAKNASTNIDVSVNADTNAISNVQNSLQNLSNSGVMKDYTATITTQADTAAIDQIKASIAGIQTKAVTITATAAGAPAVNALKASIDAVTTKTVPVTATVTGTSEVNALTSAIDGVSGKSVTVTASVFGTSSVTALASAIRNVKSKTVTVTTRRVEAAGVNGTAHADGTVNGGRAFKQGSWGAKEDGVALMGELGPEIIVRDGRWFTVGDNGAGFYQYKKNDIIFNHKQSEELLKNGYVTSGGGRGKALAEGTAFLEGTAFKAGLVGGWTPGGIKPSGSGTTVVNNTTNNYNYNSSKSSSSKSSKSSSSSAKKDAEEFEETLDWIEIAIDRVERAINSLDRTASNTFASWSDRTTALHQQMQQVRNEIDLQQKAYDRYMQEAQSSGLSADLQNKVMNGAIDIELITDETLKEQIDDFQQWYEKALDAKDAAEELKITLSELAKTEFENIIQQFEDMIETADHTHSMIDEYIAQSEAQGWIVSSKYYEAQRKNLKKQYQLLQEERGELLGELSANMANGTIKKGTKEWYEAVHAIDDVTQSAEEMYTQMLELDQLIQQADWEVFDLMQERISDIANEADFLIDLMSNEKLYEDNGQLTDRGQATMGLHGVNYNTYMAQADKYAEELRKIEAELAGDPYDTELIARRQELLDAQRDNILAAEQEKDAIKDMVEEGIQLELDYLDDLIDKYLEALQAQKDLYDYENEIRDKTDDIAMLQKQLSAYEGDSSEEAKSTIQQLTQELTEAQRELQDAEYERQISDVERLLDQMRLDYETILNSRLDNIDQLIIDMIANINANAGTISDVITSEANNVGYTLTDQMQSIWNDGNQVISYYGDNFLSSMNNVVTVINQIDTHIQSMMSKLDSIAQNKINSDKTQSSANSPQASTPVKPTPTPTPQQPSSSGGDGVPKVGDKVKFVSGNYYNDSYGTSPLGYHNRGGYVYITAINKKGSKPYHISRGSRLGSGDLGWLTLAQLSGYTTGKRKIVDDEYAWTQENGAEMIVRPSDGAILTPLAKNDSVLNADATRNIWNMANNPSDFVKENLGLGGNSVSPATTGGTTNYTQNLENVVFNLPNVKNYEQLLASMQKDRNFERLISSMTVDKIAGKNGMKKSKAIR